MIKEVEGDLLHTKCRAIAHGIAPNDHFDTGLALQLRERWPALAKDFRHWMHTHHTEPGGLWTWTAPDGTRVINLLTQSAAPGDKGRPGPARLEYVNQALRALRAEIEKEKIPSLAMPRLASGPSGLQWSEVRPQIVHYLDELAVPIYVYSIYARGVHAVEV